MNNYNIYIMNSIFYLFLQTNLNLVVIIHIYRMESIYTHIATKHIRTENRVHTLKQSNKMSNTMIAVNTKLSTSKCLFKIKRVHETMTSSPSLV